MNRAALGIALLVSIAVFGAHIGYHVWQEQHAAARWVQAEPRPSPSAWTHYIEHKDYFLGYSYALAAGFTAFALVLTLQQRRRQIGGVIGGVTLMGVLYGAGCFLIGCCGSPMLAVYLSLFGSSVLGFLKPLVAAITTASVLASGVVVVRRARRACCETCEPTATIPRPTGTRH